MARFRRAKRGSGVALIKHCFPRAVLFGTGSQLLYSLTSDTTLPFGSCTYVKTDFHFYIEIRCKVIKKYSFIA